jgi:hypothetical protein
MKMLYSLCLSVCAAGLAAAPVQAAAEQIPVEVNRPTAVQPAPVGPMEVVEAGSAQPAGRQSLLLQGGDTCGTATVLSGPLPIVVTGTTAGYRNDYNTVCEIPSQNGAPDVVYSFTPSQTDFYKISLCNDGTAFDTKLYVRVAPCESGVDVACDDDTCFTLSFPAPYVSIIESVQLQAGTQYFIIVDGWGPNDSGQYELSIERALPSAPAPECPPNTLVSQIAYGQDEAWAFYVSNDLYPDFNPAHGIKLLEHFIGVGGPINGLHWFGVGAIYDDFGKLVECPLNPGSFLVEFYAHDPDTNRPDYALGPLYSFTANAGSGLTVTDTLNVYHGADDDYRLLRWDVRLPVPYSSFEGWIAIKNLDHCAFWWAKSPEGGTIHVMWDETTGIKSDQPGDIAYCISADNTGPFTGACCDESLGVCRDTNATDCVGAYDAWYPNLRCADITCAAVSWACCVGTACLTLVQGSCQAANGTWYANYVCTTTDPRYNGMNLQNCAELPPIAPITCDTPVAYGQNLVQGYSYIFPSWVIHWFDNYSGVSQPIVKVVWWGTASTGDATCTFNEPVPVRIEFWRTVPGSSPPRPDVTSPQCSFDTTARVERTGWTFGDPQGLIYRYTAILPGSCTLASGWVTISHVPSGEDPCRMWTLSATWTNGIAWFGNPPNITYWPSSQSEVSTDMAFCLYTTVATGACCREDTGVCTNGVAENVCLAQGGLFYAGKTCAQITPPCTAKPGACCNHDTGSCTLTLFSQCAAPLHWLGANTTCDACCVVLCAGTPEGEPVCSDGYVDTYNNGCYTRPSWSFPDDWLQIADNQTYRGASGTFTTGGQPQRDFDWYYYNLTSPVALVQVHVQAEFRPDVFLMTAECPGTVLSEGVGGDCDDVIASGALAQGRYYIVVSNLGSVPCGDLRYSEYCLWITRGTAGACQLPDGTCILTSQNICIALGGTWTANQPCNPCAGLLRGDANCNGSVNAFDIDAFVLALTNPAQWQQQYTCDILCVADCNCDDQINAFDIDAFVQCLTQGGCDPCP